MSINSNLAISTDEFSNFLDSAVSVFHVQESISDMLKNAGSIQLSESDAWQLKSGQTYHIVRNQSAVIAFRPGLLPPSESGFRVVGAHTDSPALKLKLHSPESIPDSGYSCLSIEVYGSPLLYTWFDRSLGIAGRIVRRVSEDRTEVSLVSLPDAGAIIPSLAIHLNREVNDGFKFNAHENMRVLLSGNSGNNSVETLKELIAKEISRDSLTVKPEDILEADLYLFDPQPASTGGLDGSLLSSGKIDNVAGCYSNVKAFLGAEPTRSTQVAAFFDVEEIGSKTSFGADSGFLTGILHRISLAVSKGDYEAPFRAISLSRCVSNDGAHAVHPNYPQKHDGQYKPVLNGGPVVKLSASYRYATTAPLAQEFIDICSSNKIPLQFLANRADVPAGSTIGPFTNSHTQIACIDVGLPMLSMHSIRETTGSDDIGYLTKAMQAFLQS
ncbi:M18 family aminopeptidase [Spirochaeta dissipatitropha]